MFGRLGFDDVDTVGADGKIRSSANPWALQFQEDMQALAAIDDGQSLLDRLQGCMVLVFTQYCGDFVAVDVSALRGTFAPNCIPPPGWVPSPVEEVFDDDVDDVEHTFICDCTLADGRPCQQGFPTAQALAVHKSSTIRFRLQTNVHGARMFFRRCYRLETIFGERWEGVILWRYWQSRRV